MTLHAPKPKRAPRPRREPPTLTIGDVLGDKVRAINAARSRRAELEDMGFRPLKGAP